MDSSGSWSSGSSLEVGIDHQSVSLLPFAIEIFNIAMNGSVRRIARPHMHQTLCSHWRTMRAVSAFSDFE
jgi:hypothetical protein